MKTTQESSAVNRTYKDSLFKILFGREEHKQNAVDECIAEHILEDILRKEKGEIMISFLTEYDEEKHIRLEKKESLEEGIAIGKEEGCLNTLKSLVTDGILTIEDAAKRADMTAEEFCEKSGLPFTD